MRYPAIITKEEDMYIVIFRDVPEALTQGETIKDAKEMGLDALLTAFEFYVEKKEPIPLPSAVAKKEGQIELPMVSTLKVLIHNEMVKGIVSSSELGRRMKLSTRSIKRLLDFKHASQIENLEKVLKALKVKAAVVLEPL